ncbi:Peptide-N4-(N-acetyl-beta-glucosaminyl)asparagine amidase A [Phytophthora citrophthora]|uniref:Peptide-N4-(N-acetyl-beta-glucosaminyl)asparagine amidase A n=1 Tax=Phytophthora citrophthora TaxID=4793 RepID=A0AAD9G931_9STRA|nr:Peptide-N4-(N-acetyl-beta-glucosaminyl)asparagine amidase A [Phytophthora citrophthora]
MASVLGRLWDAAVTLLTAQSQLQPSSYSVSTVERAVEVGGRPYANVRGVPCVLPLLTHEFANSYWHPASETFNSPPCDEDYSVVYLKWAASCDAGVQYDRIAAVWVNGVELLRTSTAEPSREFRVNWEVVKDISLYRDIFKAGGTVVVALDNIVNSLYTSTFKVELSLEFYRPLDESKETKRPDQIVPVSSSSKSYGWFSEKPSADQVHRIVQLPDNTEELYLELFLSHHQCDEFYYSNPPDLFTTAFAENLSKRINISREDIGSCGADGAFREVQVLVDDQVVGIIWPFPLVFTGGLSPYLWKPIVGIGAFDAPTYIVNLTPFLGKFLGNRPHAIAFRVVYGEAFWLIDGNLLVFQDKAAVRPTRVHLLEERLDRYVEPAMVTLPSMVGVGNANLVGNTTALNSAFWTSVARDMYVKTIVTTSSGRKVYTLQQHFDFTNTQMYSSDGLDQWFESRTHVETKMSVTSLAKEYPHQSDESAKVQTVYVSQTEDYPLAGSVSYRLGKNGSFVLVTQFANSFSRSTTVEGLGTGPRFDYRPQDVHTALTASAVLDSRHGGGNGSTRATYASASPTDGCFSRVVEAEFGHLTVENSTAECYAYD